MAQKTVAVEKVVDNVVVTVKSGKTGEFLRQLWETHQADIRQHLQLHDYRALLRGFSGLGIARRLVCGRAEMPVT